MSTYRERREARAERLRGWADKREAKSDAAYEQAQGMAEHIPFGQPILVGHHSERRDRNYRDRIGRTYDRSFEDAAKAKSMRERAKNIEDAAAAAIYDDDPDAIERLQAKIEFLEAQRKRITDYNKSCRKALKADPESKHGDLSILDEQQQRSLASLARVAPYQIRPGGAFPGYATSNVGGTISQAKARLARLQAAKANQEGQL